MPTPTVVQTFLRPEAILREAGIRAGWKVADFGCGVGYVLVPAAKFVGPLGRVVGVDVRAVAVDESRKRVRAAKVEDRVDILRADLAQPNASGLPDGWADLVLLVTVLNQADPRAILREAARVVKTTEGRVVVIEWDQVATPVGPPPEQRVTGDTVLAAAKSAGLRMLSTLRPSPSHVGWTFIKTQSEK